MCGAANKNHGEGRRVLLLTYAKANLFAHTDQHIDWMEPVNNIRRLMLTVPAESSGNKSLF